MLFVSSLVQDLLWFLFWEPSGTKSLVLHGVGKASAVTLLSVTVKTGLYNTVSFSLFLFLLLSNSSPLPHLPQKTSRHSGGSSFIAGRRSRSTSPTQEKHVSHHDRPKKVRSAQGLSTWRGPGLWDGGGKGKSVQRALIAPRASPDSAKSFSFQTASRK